MEPLHEEKEERDDQGIVVMMDASSLLRDSAGAALDNPQYGDLSASSPSAAVITLPSSYLYRYCKTDAPDGSFHLEAILPQRAETPSMEEYYTLHMFERSSLGPPELEKLHLFNSLVVPEINARTLRFMFCAGADGAYSCCVTPAGQLAIDRYYATVPPYDAEQAIRPSDSSPDAFHAASVYTIIHNYIETSVRGRFFHTGLEFLPCATVFLPVVLREDNLQTFLAQWYQPKMTQARGEALLTIRSQTGSISVQRISPRPDGKRPHRIPTRTE